MSTFESLYKRMVGLVMESWDQHFEGEHPTRLGIGLRITERGVPTPRGEGRVHENDE